MNAPADHAVLEARLRALTRRTLSPGARYFHVSVLLLAAIMCVLVGALLLTEAGLPVRTQRAFGVLLALGAGWVVYASWVLANRHTLLAQQRVVAGWMAIVGTGAFLAGSAIAVLVTPTAMTTTAVVAAATMFIGAGVVLVRARRRTRELRALQGRLSGL